MKLNPYIISVHLRDRVGTVHLTSNRMNRALAYPAIYNPGMPLDEKVAYVLPEDVSFPAEEVQACRFVPAFFVPDATTAKAVKSIDLVEVPGLSAAETLVMLQEVFTCFNEWDRSLLCSALKGAHVGIIGKLITPVLGKSVILYDRFYQTLFCERVPGDEEVPLERTVNEAIPDWELAAIRKHHEFFTTRKPYSPDTFREDFGREYLCYNLFVGEKRRGILAILGGVEGLDESDWALIKFLGDHLCAIFANDPESDFDLPARLQDKVRLLIDGKKVPQRDLAAALGDVGWTCEGNFICVSIVDRAIARSVKTLRRIAEAVCAQLPDSIDIVHDDAITFVCNVNRRAWNIPGLAQSIADLAHVDREAQRIGVSAPFGNFQDVALNRKNSIRAVELGRLRDEDALVYYYDELFLEYLAWDCVDARSIKAAMPHEFFLLRKQDEEFGTDLYAFMKVYLENERSVAATARAFYVHKNTVLNRVRRIEEICHVDFEDPVVRLRLLAAYSLAEKLEL